MRKFIIGGLIILLVVISIFVLSFIKQEGSGKQEEKLTVVTTLFPLYDFAKNIGGDKVEVIMLLPPGVEPHGFEPTPSDIVKINEADLFVYTGEFMETWAADIIQGITEKDVKIVDASLGIELMKEEEDGENADKHEEESEHQHGGVDPHIWLDFDNAQKIVETIATSMSEKDPVNAKYFEDNANTYKNKLMELDNNYQTSLTNCQNREIVYGGHYAFGYLAKKYDLSYVAAQGFSPNSEPTAKDLVELVQQIRENNISYVYYEELSSSKIAETLAEETQAQILLLNGAHNLSKEDYENRVTFISLMENNLNNLVQGLGCIK